MSPGTPSAITPAVVAPSVIAPSVITPSVITNVSPAVAGCWHPVARLADLGDLQRVEVAGVGYVVRRTANGWAAFVDQCPHRLARLSDGVLRDDTLVCPYHGWEFDGGGTCTQIPALGPTATVPSRACLSAVRVAEHCGALWLAPAGADPAIGLPEIAEWDAPGLTPVWLPVVDVRCGAAQFIDNFLDFAHFPFVHAGTFGDSESPLIHDYTVQRRPHGLAVHYEHTIVNNEDALVATGQHPLVQPRVMRYTYTVPFTAVLHLELPVTGVTNALVTFCQPVSADLTKVYTVMLRNDCATPEAAQEAIDYELAVMAEDLRVLERLPDTALALDATAQLHTRADRLTVEFRRLLRDLVT